MEQPPEQQPFNFVSDPLHNRSYFCFSFFVLFFFLTFLFSNVLTQLWNEVDRVSPNIEFIDFFYESACKGRKFLIEMKYK